MGVEPSRDSSRTAGYRDFVPRFAKRALAVAASGLAVAVLTGAVLSAGDETATRTDQLPRGAAKPEGKPVVLALATGSTLAANILAEWKRFCPMFRKVMPLEYRRALAEMEKAKMAAMQAAE